MPVPQVVIVGRPNVGKSSLLNWLAGRRISIVDDQAGVTRDRIVYLMEAGGRFFELVDTGGIGIEDCDNLTKEVEAQIEAGIESADVVLFVVDTRSGLLPLDEEVARRLRYIDKPIILVANKADSENLDPQADEFYKLGRGKMIKVSTQQNRHQEELLRMILERLPEQTHEEEEVGEPEMKMAIVGRRNTGKSTFVNTLARAERCIVSEVPGTTRDSVDVRFELDGKTFMAIDTPGLKRSRSVKTDIDFYSSHRAQRSIRRADVVLLFFDCSQRLSKVDKQLCKYIADNYKPCIFVVNKWDLLYGQMPTEKWVDYLRDTFSTMWHVPIAFITGQTGKNVKALLNHAQMLFKQSLQRVTTAKLNSLLREALEKHPAPMQGIVRPKIYFGTQVSTQPPTIVLMCNEPGAFTPSYRRYLLGYLRDHLDFGEVPIKLYLQRREQKLRGRPDNEPDVLARQDARQDSLQPLVVDDEDGGHVLDDDGHVFGEEDYQAVDTDSSDVNLHEE
ncbi:ribosome biogenesis GTPase Der [Anatilimnocola floriformis]|uniref:ribosome biogenesis GTPase Der n=1 Tax=Anatilimnocola floriformis TaxID=2948575 RepID=UPI0020C1F044|nr:ribosome biogenesis GTPase Der [Anatilimnocola floriformis]